MDQNDPAFSPSRQATRAPVNLLVRLEADPEIGTFEARCNNISIGGMFVLTNLTPEAGKQLRFELEVPDAGIVRGLAEVVWCQPASELRPAGIGFKFRYLEQRDRQLIFKLVSRHIKERLASRPAAPPPPAPATGPPPAILSPPGSQAGPPAFAIGGLETPGAPPPDPPAPNPPLSTPPASPPHAAPEPPAAPPVSSLPTSPTPSPPTPSPPTPSPPTPSPPEPSQPPALFEEEESPFSFQPAPELDEPPLGAQQSLNLAPPSPGEASPPSFGTMGAGGASSNLSTGPSSFAPDLAGGGAADAGQASFDLGATSPSGFSDLGGPSEPTFGYQGGEPEPSGPSVLDESVGDSLFGDNAGVDGNPLGQVDTFQGDAVSPSPLAEPEPGYSEYLGEDHFDHRPKPKKERPMLIVAGLVLLLAAALAYLFGDKIFDFGSRGGAELGSSAAESSGEAPGAGESAGVAAEPPTQAAARGNTRPTPPPRGDGPLQSLGDVTFRRAGQAAELVVATNRNLNAGQFDNFRLDGEKPREVIRLFGFERGEWPTLTVGHAGVRQVRVGWHRQEQGGPQVHLVIDLDDPKTRVVSLKPDGRRLIIRLEDR